MSELRSRSYDAHFVAGDVRSRREMARLVFGVPRSLRLHRLHRVERRCVASGRDRPEASSCAKVREGAPFSLAQTSDIASVAAFLLSDDRTPRVRVITLNRPGRMNATDGPTLEALNAAIHDCSAPGGDARDADVELGDAHLHRNLLPSAGSSQRLPRRIGLSRPLYWLLTGRRMTGRDAGRIGVAAVAVPANGLALERWMQFRHRDDSPAMVRAIGEFTGTVQGGLRGVIPSDMIITIEKLHAMVQEIQDREAIRDCLMRYARGVDRFERELILSASIRTGGAQEASLQMQGRSEAFRPGRQC